MQAVVITGLAHGIGREVARLLAKSKVPVAGFDVDADGIESLKKELEEAGCAHLLTTLDVTDRPGILKFRDAVLAKFGRVDAVVSNVGVDCFGPFEELDLDKALKWLEINVIGAAAIFQAFLPSMRENRSGKLVALSSMLGQLPFPFDSIYSASKYAIEGLAATLRIEVEPFGIKVALIQPAQVSTSFAARRVPPAEGSPYRERAIRFIERDKVLVRQGLAPTQVAATIVKVIRSRNPNFFNEIIFRDRAFMSLSRVLPYRVRDAILVRHMGIRA
jgi:short-subunit dehydrogenase